MNNGYNNQGGYDPFGTGKTMPEYDFYDELITRDARRAVSRTHIGLTVLSASAALVIVIAQIVLMLALGEDGYNELAKNIYFRMLMSFLPMYLVGLPIMYLICRRVPKRTLRRGKMSFPMVLAMIPIAQLLMTVGNLIGLWLNAFVGAVKGEEVVNQTSELIASAPPVLVFFVVVILGPLVEELIFRKIIFDRLSTFGMPFAIIVTAVSFGLFHGNLYQFFYAVLVGIVLGFIVAKSGNWLYAVLVHAVMNFIGGFLSVIVADSVERYNEYYEAILGGEALDMAEYATDIIIATAYSGLVYALIGGGVALLIVGIKRGWFKLYDPDSVRIRRGKIAAAVFGNPGAIIFLAFMSFEILYALII